MTSLVTPTRPSCDPSVPLTSPVAARLLLPVHPLPRRSLPSQKTSESERERERERESERQHDRQQHSTTQPSNSHGRTTSNVKGEGNHVDGTRRKRRTQLFIVQRKSSDKRLTMVVRFTGGAVFCTLQSKTQTTMNIITCHAQLHHNHDRNQNQDHDLDGNRNHNHQLKYKNNHDRNREQKPRPRADTTTTTRNNNTQSLIKATRKERPTKDILTDMCARLRAEGEREERSRRALEERGRCKQSEKRPREARERAREGQSKEDPERARNNLKKTRGNAGMTTWT